MKFRLNCLTQAQINAILQAYEDLKALNEEETDITCNQLEKAFKDIDFDELNNNAYV